MNDLRTLEDLAILDRYYVGEDNPTLELTFSIDENVAILGTITSSRYRYSVANKKGNVVSYYTRGWTIRNTKNSENPGQVDTKFYAEISVAKETPINNVWSFRNGRRTFAILGLTLTQARFEGKLYPGIDDLDVSKFGNIRLDVDIGTRVAVAYVSTDLNFRPLRSVDESVVDFETTAMHLMQRMQEQLATCNNGLTNRYEYTSVIDTVNRVTMAFINFLRLNEPFEETRELRENLVNVLCSDNPVNIDNDTKRIVLSKITIDNIRLQKKDGMANFFLGRYCRDGVYFKDISEYESLLAYCEAFGATIKDRMNIKRKDNRFEYMLTGLSYQQRLEEMQENELYDDESVVFALTDEEMEQYSNARTANDTKTLAVFIQVAKNRWSEVHGSTVAMLA